MAKFNTKTSAKLNTKTSVVDYLKSKGQSSSFSNRAKLASQVGIKNYQGTASQNAALLKALQSQNKTSPSKPQNVATKPVVTTPKPPVPKPQNVATKPVVTMPKPPVPKPQNVATKPVVTMPKLPPSNSQMEAEIKRKAELGIPLSNPTPAKQALYNKYQQAAANVAPKPVVQRVIEDMQILDPLRKPTMPNPLEDKVNLLESEFNKLRDTLPSKSDLEQYFMQSRSDLEEYFTQFYEMQSQPMYDIGQLASLLQPPQPQFNMSEITAQFTDMFTKLQNEYNARLEAMQRMLEQQNAELQKRYEELLNKFKYNESQLAQIVHGVVGGVGNGIGLFDGVTPNGTPTSTSGTPVGYRQYAQMNDALLRYMQNLWGGGF